MPIELTKQQEDCVMENGNILVSAAAGSGKTAVLVERVINKICNNENPVSADKLLIVTFTNAAAAEMRSRIEKRLQEECEKNPNNLALLRQKLLLSTAKICTIDSFCIDLIRENFENVGVSPDFKISDGQALRPYDEKVMSSIINRYIEEGNETFLSLLDLIGAEFDDNNFKELALDLYYYSRQMPFPKKWFESLCDFYNNGIFDRENVWYEFAFSVAKEVILDIKNNLASAIDLVAVNEKAVDKYLPAFISAKAVLETLESAVESMDWNSVYDSLNSIVFPSLPRVNGVSGIYEITAAKTLYKYITEKSLLRLNKIFYADFEFINSQFSFIYEPLCLLKDILLEFEEKIFEEYLKINSFTFHNTEQLALSLLCEEENGIVKIKDDAYEFLDRFDEVMVDEYQDTNNLQDMLFYVLSNKEQKLFVVGDVKQSIYGFRGANPSNFLAKKDRYLPLENADGSDAKKIILSKNFRCKPEVCDFINYFFKSFMTKETGNIIYNEEEELVAGAKYPKTEDISSQFALIDCKNADLPPIIYEARYIASYIKEIMSKEKAIRVDNDVLRPARYSDFTILLRSPKTKASIIGAELRRQGIPVNFSKDEFADATEVATVLSLLKVIDNPESDIELLTVLMSPIFSFTPDELALFRANKRDGNIFSTIIFASNNGDEKASRFLKRIEKYRLFAMTNSLNRLISYIINDTGYIDAVSAMSDGAVRRGNLLLLCDYASQYIANNSTTIGGFVKYIIKQSQSGIKSADNVVAGDTVNIMSIHASKGLQFPVCIIAGISSSFNASESLENTIFSTDFGIGFKYYDEDLKEKFTTVGRELILEKMHSERLSEELRLLYVAMTRTQDRMLFVSSHKNAEKKIEDIKTMLISSNSKITSSIFKRTKSYLDWMLLSLICHQDGKELRYNGSAIMVSDDTSRIKVDVTDCNSILDEYLEEETEKVEIIPEISDKIKENLSFEYPYKKLLPLESKASVSSIANKAESKKYAYTSLPTFMSGGLTGAKRGTAMHKVMQFFDFSMYDNIEEEIERLTEWQFITEEEAESINIDALRTFFESDIFARIKKSKLVKREMRFLTEISATKISPDLDRSFENEKIIVQGAVDLCFVEENSVVILDFKTDRVDDAKALKDSYSEQLEIYAMACEKIFEKEVKEKIIYSFALNKEILL